MENFYCIIFEKIVTYDGNEFTAAHKLLRKNLDVKEDKILYIGRKYGYTGTCSPFTTLYEGIVQGKVKKGDYILIWAMAAEGYHIFNLIKY